MGRGCKRRDNTDADGPSNGSSFGDCSWGYTACSSASIHPSQVNPVSMQLGKMRQQEFARDVITSCMHEREGSRFERMTYHSNINGARESVDRPMGKQRRKGNITRRAQEANESGIVWQHAKGRSVIGGRRQKEEKGEMIWEFVAGRWRRTVRDRELYAHAPFQSARGPNSVQRNRIEAHTAMDETKGKTRSEELGLEDSSQSCRSSTGM